MLSNCLSFFSLCFLSLTVIMKGTALIISRMKGTRKTCSQTFPWKQKNTHSEISIVIGAFSPHLLSCQFLLFVYLFYVFKIDLTHMNVYNVTNADGRVCWHKLVSSELEGLLYNLQWENSRKKPDVKCINGRATDLSSNAVWGHFLQREEEVLTASSPGPNLCKWPIKQSWQLGTNNMSWYGKCSEGKMLPCTLIYHKRQKITLCGTPSTSPCSWDRQAALFLRNWWKPQAPAK